MLSIFVGLVVGPVVTAFITIIVIGLWGAIAHGLLRLTGATEGGRSTTYQALCYSTGANVVSAVTCIGGYFGWIWWLISAVIIALKMR